jgi:HEAT repeat protein
MRVRLASVLFAVVVGGVDVARAQFGQDPYPSPQTPYRAPVDSRGRLEREQRGNDVEQFAKRLESSDPADRIEAVEDLGLSSDSRAVNYLLKAVGDPDPRVQVLAVDFLGDRRSTDAAPLLVQKLFLTGAPQPFRLHLLAALGKIGDPRSSRPILDFISQEANADTRGTAIYTLGEIGDISVRQDLQRVRDGENDPRVQKVADDVLAKLGSGARPANDRFVPPSNALVPPLKPGS